MNRIECKWLLCYSQGEIYGLDLKWVREIDYRPQILPLPTAELPLLGLYAWHGEQLPAISLDSIIGLEREPKANVAMVLEVGGRHLALLVSEMGQAITVTPQDIFHLDPCLTANKDVAFQAVRLEGQLIFKLEINALADLTSTRVEMASGSS